MTQAGRWAMKCGKCGERYTWDGPCHPIPPCPKCSPAKGDARRPDCVVEAIGLCEEILDRIDELPEAGWDFGNDIREKVESVKANIETHNRVTDGQQQALENWLDGIERWFHD